MNLSLLFTIFTLTITSITATRAGKFMNPIIAQHGIKIIMKPRNVFADLNGADALVG